MILHSAHILRAHWRETPPLSEDAVARILFAQGNQQGWHMPAVTLDDRDQVGVLRAGHADAVDDHVGHLVATVGRVELPIDPDWRSVVDLDPARYDDPSLIGLAPQHLEAFTAERAKGCGIGDDDIVLVKSDELLPLQCRRLYPICPESGTGAGFHVEILTEKPPEYFL